MGFVYYYNQEGNKKMKNRRSTGIYDKNNHLIYEGDILICESKMVFISTGKPTGEMQRKEYLVKWETPKARWGRWDIEKEKFALLSGLHQDAMQFYTIKEA